MGGGDKLFACLAGELLLAHAVEPFERSPQVADIVLVMRADALERGWELAREQGWSKVSQVCPGGRRRQDSVREGLSQLKGCSWVLIHDGARPLVTELLIERGLEMAEETGAAVPGLPVSDTIKVIDDQGLVEQTPPRDRLNRIQTPQAFNFDLIWEAHNRWSGGDVPDDATLLEALGAKVKVFPGDPYNIKVTTPVDMVMAEALLAHRRKVKDASRHRV